MTGGNKEIVVELYPEVDAPFVMLREGESDHFESLDDALHLGYDKNGEFLWLSLLSLSDGVMDILTSGQREKAARELEQRGLKTLA